MLLDHARMILRLPDRQYQNHPRSFIPQSLIYDPGTTYDPKPTQRMFVVVLLKLV
jgi:hypothetical protein